MRHLSEPAFILHTRPYRETSLIVEAFSRNHGRLGVVAKGARNPKSRLRALLLPFQPLLLSWSGKGDLALLTGAEAVGTARQLVGKNRYAAFYLNELLMRLLHRHDAHPELFDRYSAALEDLHENDAVQDSLRIFEKHLLAGIGYAMILDHDAGSGQPLKPDQVYEYLPERGPELIAGNMGAGHKLLGSSLLDLNQESFHSGRSRYEARRLTRYLIERQIADRSLRSRQIFHQVISAFDSRVN